MNRGFGNNVRVQTVAKIDRIDVVTVSFKLAFFQDIMKLIPSSSKRPIHMPIAYSPTLYPSISRPSASRLPPFRGPSSDKVAVKAYHSRSLYIIVKNTCKNRLTALISTANRYNHASPDIILGQICESRRKRD